MKREVVVGDVTDLTLGSARVVVFYKLEGGKRQPIPAELISAAIGYRVGKRWIILPVPERFRIRGPMPYGWGSPVGKEEALAHAVSRISFVLFGNERSEYTHSRAFQEGQVTRAAAAATKRTVVAAALRMAHIRA
jgi:hypothetical protein